MADLNDQIEELVKHAVETNKARSAASAAAVEQFKANESRALYIARVATDVLMHRLTLEGDQGVKETNEEISYQITLLSSFVHTHFIVTNLLLRSSLIEACVLIRKQLESLARMQELDDKPIDKLVEKTANIQNQLGKEFKEAYSPLSRVAHFNSPDVSQFLPIVNFPNGDIGPSSIPMYQDESHSIYRIYLAIVWNFVYWFIGKKEQWYPDYDPEPDYRQFVEIAKVMTEAEDLGI